MIGVGEPWNSIAVDRGVGRMALVTAQIWRRGVEKVLALRKASLDSRAGDVAALLTAWMVGVNSFVGTLALGVILGFAGAIPANTPW